MRLAMSIGKAFGGVILILASMAILTGLSLFVVGGFLTTWPIMRMSPQNRRVKSVMDLAVSLMALARAYGKDENAPKST